MLTKFMLSYCQLSEFIVPAVPFLILEDQVLCPLLYEAFVDRLIRSSLFFLSCPVLICLYHPYSMYQIQLCFNVTFKTFLLDYKTFGSMK